MHNHDITTHLVDMNDAQRPLGMCFHSDVFQELLHVLSLMQVSVFQLCRIIDGIPQLMFPS